MLQHEAVNGSEWWRSGVIYQIYPRSFADSNGDGMGDLAGITRNLSAIAELGVDAIWLSPFYSSPQKDAGYDVSDYKNVDPLFGTLEDFDNLIERAHELNLRVMIDLVPNHSSDQHDWFQQALDAPEGSPARDYYHFKDGRGKDGELPPNNRQSMFGGPAWTRLEDGQWYLHLFDSSQPDLNWENPAIHKEFESILRFWLDRDIDGFRVTTSRMPWASKQDCPTTPMRKKPELDSLRASQTPRCGFRILCTRFSGLGGRSWRVTRVIEPCVARLMCFRSRKWRFGLDPMSFTRHLTSVLLDAGWDKAALVSAINESFEAFDEVGAPSTWVLNNHDVIRHVSRFGGDFGRDHLPQMALALMQSSQTTRSVLKRRGPQRFSCWGCLEQATSIRAKSWAFQNTQTFRLNIDRTLHLLEPAGSVLAGTEPGFHRLGQKVEQLTASRVPTPPGYRSRKALLISAEISKQERIQPLRCTSRA